MHTDDRHPGNHKCSSGPQCGQLSDKKTQHMSWVTKGFPSPIPLNILLERGHKVLIFTKISYLKSNFLSKH